MFDPAKNIHANSLAAFHKRTDRAPAKEWVKATGNYLSSWLPSFLQTVAVPVDTFFDTNWYGRIHDSYAAKKGIYDAVSASVTAAAMGASALVMYKYGDQLASNDTYWQDLVRKPVAAEHIKPSQNFIG